MEKNQGLRKRPGGGGGMDDDISVSAGASGPGSSTNASLPRGVGGRTGGRKSSDVMAVEEGAGDLKRADAASSLGASTVGGANVSSGTKAQLIAIFVLLGCAQLFYWNSVLNILFSLSTKLYPGQSWIKNTITAVNNTASILATVFTIWQGALSTTVVCISFLVMGAGCLLTALTTQFITGAAGAWCLISLAVLTGLAAAFAQSGGYSLASVMPINVGGYFSVGQGVSGVVSWFVWYCISELTMRKATKPQVRTQMWIQMGIAALLYFTSGIVFYFMAAKPEIRSKIDRAAQTMRAEAANPAAPSYLALLKDSWPLTVGIFISFFTTLFIFPNIGPLTWSVAQTSWLTWFFFAFQLGDFVGRFIPNLFAFTVLSAWQFFVWVSVRLVFVLTFGILGWKQKANAFLGGKAWLLVLVSLIALTNGHACSNAFIVVGDSVSKRYQPFVPRVCSVLVLSLLCGISAGLWISFGVLSV